MMKKARLNKPEKNSFLKNILVQFCLVAASVVLFVGSFPNPLIKDGLSFLAWFAYIPVLLLIPKSSIPRCIGWGAIYGFFTYLIFNYWLWTFHPFAGVFVYCLYLFYMAVVFFLFKLSDILFPKRAYIVQWLVWLAYEYTRSLGFLGYPYGITGYSQWQVIPIIQIASVTGVWGVSALVAFPSFFLAAALKDWSVKPALGSNEEKNILSLKSMWSSLAGKIYLFFRNDKIPAICWTLAIAAALVFACFNIKDYSAYPKANIGLVQHNSNPWDAANASSTLERLEAYKKDLSSLKKLSDDVLESQPKPDLIVWPETAFIPRIYWHSTYRDDQEMWLLVKELLDYLALKNTPFLIGNDDARMDPVKNPNKYENSRVDYNAALLYEKGQITGIYRKTRLVPFVEHFPYKDRFPFIYRLLLKMDTQFWEEGEEKTVLKIDNFSFCAPICFEDTFGYLPRIFVRGGADVIVNITNDAWARSLSSQKQHLSTAVFRTVENRRSMVRSTVSGQTCAIDPNGRIIAEAPPFSGTWLNVTVPIAKKDTIYSFFGDYLGITFFLLAGFMLISRAVWYTIKRVKRGSER